MDYQRKVRLFRNGANQAVRIPREFELPGNDAVMRKEGDRLIIEPAIRKADLRTLLEQWRREAPLEPVDDFPEIDDLPAEPFDL